MMTLKHNNIDSKPIKLGIVGLGRAFMLMLPTFLKDERIHLVGAAERNNQQLADFLEQFPESTIGSIDALCADENIDAIYVATPHEMHCDQVIKILSADKHVLVEKPITINAVEAKTIADAVLKSKGSVIVGPSHSYDLPIIETAKILRSGKYGPIGMINAQYYTDFVYRPRRPEELDTTLGGGVIFNQGAHHADILLALIDAKALSVSACVGNFDPNRPCDGAYSAIVEFENNCFANMTYSGYGHYDGDQDMAWISELGVPKNPDTYGVARKNLQHKNEDIERIEKSNKGYQKGYTLPQATYNEHFGRIIISCQKADLRPTATGIHIYADDKHEFISLPQLEVPRSTVIDELYQLVHYGKSPIHSAERALNTISICEAIHQSSKDKKRIELSY
ncbi:Gfo/Idh/MocA family oxidoreductase [Colwellia sp. 6M3]|jgi:phthalate 4,5-cis-dihydrodiol dehydrogenase|uniref:Gfo/Idh/MocA family protein n=1 Tax=Colwellia sp. 6M3 TaxID=2759849 RepID=UPI0015F530BB|nr:Gfo/Idh/MocA family oxidoreductase [Colwellia sp. 6M3]MBA6416985.1 Gfo/Idh/MocA family oxidoreductase [Colwellia sp. 6M3]